MAESKEELKSLLMKVKEESEKTVLKLNIQKTKIKLKLMSIESVMPSNHLILCHPFLLLPSIFPSTRVFSNKTTLLIRWPKIPKSWAWAPWLLEALPFQIKG